MRRLLLIMLCVLGLSLELLKLDIYQQILAYKEQAFMAHTSQIVLQIQNE